MDLKGGMKRSRRVLEVKAIEQALEASSQEEDNVEDEQEETARAQPPSKESSCVKLKLF